MPRIAGLCVVFALAGCSETRVLDKSEALTEMGQVFHLMAGDSYFLAPGNIYSNVARDDVMPPSECAEGTVDISTGETPGYPSNYDYTKYEYENCKVSSQNGSEVLFNGLFEDGEEQESPDDSVWYVDYFYAKYSGLGFVSNGTTGFLEGQVYGTNDDTRTSSYRTMLEFRSVSDGYEYLLQQGEQGESLTFIYAPENFAVDGPYSYYGTECDGGSRTVETISRLTFEGDAISGELLISLNARYLRYVFKNGKSTVTDSDGNSVILSKDEVRKAIATPAC